MIEVTLNIAHIAHNPFCTFQVFLVDFGCQLDGTIILQMYVGIVRLQPELIADMANNNTSPTDLPNHRGLEIDPSLIHPDHLMLLNDYLRQYKVGQPAGSILNPNHVSTGLRLSYEDEEHNNSSVTSASENLKAVPPVIAFAGNNLKIEIAHQNEEFEQFLKLQVITFSSLNLDHLYLWLLFV